MKSAMYKFALFFFILAYSNAKTIKKVFNKDKIDIDEGFGGKNNVLREKVCLAENSKDALWVLDLNDDELNFKQLRSPNKADRRVFREVMEPAIKNYKYWNLSQTVDDKELKEKTHAKEENIEEITKYDVKKEILWMFNKFIMPYQGEPSLHCNLGDNNKVSIKLYFKGPFTSLVVRYKNKRWNYFFNPPSSLPRWFYEKHSKVIRSGQGQYVDIPEAVRNEFYGKFFYILQGFLRFDL